MRRWSLLLVGLLVAACANAPPPETAPVVPSRMCAHPSRAEVVAAKGAHKAAARFFDRGEYDEAIRCWTDAYAFDCTAHDLLLNIASALEKKGDVAGSLAQIEVYLQHRPATPVVVERTRRLRAELGAER